MCLLTISMWVSIPPVSTTSYTHTLTTGKHPNLYTEQMPFAATTWAVSPAKAKARVFLVILYLILMLTEGWIEVSLNVSCVHMLLALPSAWNSFSFFPNWQTLRCLLRPTSIPPLPWNLLKTLAHLWQTWSLLTSLCTHCTFYLSPLLFLFVYVNNYKLFQHFSWASLYAMYNWWDMKKKHPIRV